MAPKSSYHNSSRNLIHPLYCAANIGWYIDISPPSTQHNSQRTMAMRNNRDRAVEKSPEEQLQEFIAAYTNQDRYGEEEATTNPSTLTSGEHDYDRLVYSPATSHHGPVAPPIATFPRSVVPGDGTQSPVPLWSVHHQTPGAHHQTQMITGMMRAPSTDFLAPQMHHHTFPTNYPVNSNMMGLGQLAMPSASSTIPGPYIPREFINVAQPPFVFPRKASQRRFGSLPPGAVSIYFKDKNGQYPGMPAFLDSTCLEGRDDTVLYRVGDFPPTNARVHIHWPNCHDWAHDIQLCRQRDMLPATRGTLYDRVRRLVLNNFRVECVPDPRSNMSPRIPDPNQLREDQFIIKEFTPVTHGSWRIELTISMP